mgnify:CR=1 FL=1
MNNSGTWMPAPRRRNTHNACSAKNCVYVVVQVLQMGKIFLLDSQIEYVVGLSYWSSWQLRGSD